MLIFEADDTLRPGYVDFLNDFRATVVRQANGPMAIYTEGFDLARMDRPGYLAELFDWHCRKYRGRDLRVIVSIGMPALDYAARWRDECSPGTPIVFAAVGARALERMGRPPLSTGLTQSTEPGEIVAIAFELLPQTKHLVVVDGPAARDAYVRDFLESARTLYADRAEILDLTGLPMPELLERVAHLPPRSVIAFTSLLTDGAGRTFIGRHAAQLVSAAANAPMFGMATTTLGYGTVGGRLFSPEKIGRDSAELALRVFRGERAESIPVRDAVVTEYAFDAAQMERWGLDPAAVPPGSRVINRRPTLWEAHRATVLAASVAIAAQALLIAALLRERRRRQRTLTQLHRLSGELISSQEKERRRVARDLHDDVGQRLALLSIELEQLRRSAGPDAAIGEALSAAAQRADSISTDVHGIARDLHPARLETLGLSRALQAYADEAAKRHAVGISVALVDWPDRIRGEQALALYRIAQEAVQNAVRHGGARTISIELNATPARLEMVVADDGRGFESPESPSGIGLAGMSERASLVRGRVAVESEPGEGTSIHVVLPRESGAQPVTR